MFSRGALGACRASSKVHRVHVARSLATAAAEAEGSASAPAAAPPINRARAGHRKRGNAIIHTAVIVNRSPILTRTPTPFERAYYAYQARIERALHNPLPTEFYFKPGSLLEGIFTREESARERKAFGGPRVLNINKKPDDEGEDEAKGPHTLLPGEEPAPKLMSRISKADRTGDVKSLDRKGERNMYLLIQGKDETGKEVWRFPQSELGPEEMLHQAAQRPLKAQTGMDTWLVARKPIGVHRPTPSSSVLIPQNAAQPQKYLFFFKAHILAGQVRPDGQSILDFAWLTKEEIEPRVDKSYWDIVKDMLSDF